MSYAIKNVSAARSYPLANERMDSGDGLVAPRVDPGRYLDLLFANFWLMAAIAAAVTLAGVAYALLATPVYKATVLFQVEDTGALPPAVSPTDALRPFDIKTVGAPELEVLRSRMVVSAAVDSTRSFIEIQPRYFPVIGSWLARNNLQPSIPGILGEAGYAWGPARAELAVFNVPASLEGTRFTLAAGEADTFVLSHEDEGVRFSGRIGQLLSYQAPGGPIEIKVDRIDARPGAEFELVRQPRLVAIEKLQRDMEVQERGRQSGIISVSLEDTDPARATAILQQVVHQYLTQNARRQSEGAEKQLEFLNRQLPELRLAVEESEQKYNEARNRRGTIDLGEEARGLLQLSIANKTTMMELEQKRAELSSRFQPEHPTVQAVDQQIRLVNRDLNQLNAKIKRLPQIEQEIVRLNRDVKVNTEVYTNVMNAAQQLRLASASKVGNIRLLDAPAMPVKPVKPRRMIVVFSAAVIGVLLGLLVVLMKKGMRGRVYSPAEIEQSLGLPVGGIILHSPRRKRLFSPARSGNGNELLPRDLPSDIAIEGLRRLQSCLHGMMPEPANETMVPGLPRLYNAIVVVAGPTPGVGKSFVSSNFAVVLASSGRKVLLIDADLRTGGLHRQFGLERGLGLAEAIRNGAPLDGTIHRGVVENLDFMSTGRLSSMPAELLSNRNLESLLCALASRYDAVVIDTAPVLCVADTLMIAPHADILFNVVRSGVTTINEIDEVDKQLRRAGARPGTVIYNDMKSRQSHYGYSAAYG